MLSKFRVCSLVAGAALLLLPATSNAQLNNQWVTFSKQPAKLALAPLVLSDSDTQVLFRTADMDQDGWDDVVAVRKQQASQLGPKASYLLMNVNGTLTDKTAQYAGTSDTSHDSGFLTPRNTRECAIGDVNGDGWDDVVTANSLSDGKPKNISHPGVYVNEGSIAGNWQGIKLENARVPQLKTVGGLDVAPRFCGMGLGDVTGDGSLDVYFVDYDTTETNISEPGNWDLNDRLLTNDGLGFYTDTSAARFTTTQLLSAFGADAEMGDINNDGVLDIIKDTTLNNPTAVRILYNNPANIGTFSAMGVSDLGSGSPYGMDLGDLNHDNLMDVAIADDGNDRFRLGTGFDGLNRMIWGPLKTYTFVNGSDDGFGHNVYIRDLDGDGWNDVLITDVDGDLTGCGRRLHIYHNTGSVPGDMNLVIKEEVELASGSQGAGWKGAVGISSTDSHGSYDVGFGDFDKDGDLDLLIATCAGTQYFQNETNPVTVICQDDMGFGGPGDMVFSICGDDLTQAASVATMEVTGGAPGQPMFIPLALAAGTVPFKGGTLVPFPIISIVIGLSLDGNGDFTSPVPGSAGTPVHVYMQVIVKNGSVYEFSNALDCLFGV